MSLDNFYTPDSSFFEADKFGRLAAKREQKAERILSKPDPVDLNTGSSLLDLFNSSAVREAGIQGDIGGEINNSMFGGTSNVTAEDGYSSPAVADEFVGADPRLREALNVGTNKVYEDIAQSNYWDAAKDTAAIALPLAADSGGSLLAGLAGAVGTSLAMGPLAGVTSLALRGNKLVDTISGAMDDYGKVKKGLELTGKAGKHVAQSSVLISGDVERQVQEYRKENNGESPSGERFAGMVLGSTIVMSAQLGIGKGFLPKDKKSLTAIEAAVRAAKPTRGNARKVIDSLIGGATKIGIVGSEEALQEYVQQWQQILSKNVDPKTGQSMFDAIKAELANPKNQLETKVAAALGFGAGGATKGVAVAPGLAFNVGVNTTVGTAKAVHKPVAGAITGMLNRSARKKLSETDKRELHNEQANASVLAEQNVESFKEQANVIKNAATVEDLKANPELAEIIANYQGTKPKAPLDQGTDESNEAFKTRVVIEDRANQDSIANNTFSDTALQGADTFKAFKEILTLNNTNLQKVVKKSVTAPNIAHFSKRTGKPKDVNTAPATSESIASLVDKVAPKGEESIKAAKGLETELAVNVVNRFNADSTVVSKIGLAQAKQLSDADLERVTALVSGTNPAAAAKLSKLIKGKERALNRFSPKTNRIIDDTDTSDTSKALAQIAEEGISDNARVPAISSLLSTTMKNNIKGAKVIDALRKTIAHYENTEAFKEQGKGVIHPTTLAKWKKRLDKAEEAHKDTEVPVGLARVAEVGINEEESIPESVPEAAKLISTAMKGDLKGEGIVSALRKSIAHYEGTKAFKEQAEGAIHPDTTAKWKKRLDEETVVPKEPETKKEEVVEETKDSSEEVEPEVTTRTKGPIAHKFLSSLAADIDAGNTEQSVALIVAATNMLKRKGYTTNEDFDSILKAYPSIKNDAATYNRFILETYTLKEAQDDIATKELSTKDAKLAYETLFPGCKP